MQLAEQVQKKAEVPTELAKQVKEPDWRRNFKEHDNSTRRVMTAVKTTERDEQWQ
jgi:hypothetical protein